MKNDKDRQDMLLEKIVIFEAQKERSLHQFSSGSCSSLFAILLLVNENI